MINANIPGSDMLAGFKNVDDIVASAKERQDLEILATTAPSKIFISRRIAGAMPAKQSAAAP